MNNKSLLKTSHFEKEIGGKRTHLFFLCNAAGTEIAITNYGAALVSIMLPDREGHYDNVILSHDTIDGLINSPEPYLNTIIGRYSNRIAKGKFQLNNKRYELARNNGPNHLHGGPTGFHRRVWDAYQVNDTTLKLHYVSSYGEEGFRGEVETTLTYHLTEENALEISYSARTNRTTLVNLTNHAFFNLSGQAQPTPTVLDHEVMINADFYTPTDAMNIPTGEILKVKNTPMDFCTAHTIGERIENDFEQLKFGAGYDHNYVLNKQEENELSLAATCYDPNSGRCMTVHTTEPGLQLYTGNWLNGFSGAHGNTFPKNSAICFEAQRFPDTPNHPYFPSAWLKPNEEYKQLTIYKFELKD